MFETVIGILPVTAGLDFNELKEPTTMVAASGKITPLSLIRAGAFGAPIIARTGVPTKILE